MKLCTTLLHSGIRSVLHFNLDEVVMKSVINFRDVIKIQKTYQILLNRGYKIYAEPGQQSPPIQDTEGAEDGEERQQEFITIEFCREDQLVRRKLYFLAACSIIDDDINLEHARKLRPYGGLIGIDNSRLDRYLKFSKVLRLHAVLHDAAGFIKEYNQSGPGYAYALSCPINSCFVGHVSGLLFCLYIRTLHRDLFNQLEC